jgi:hypothetical protein
MREALTQGPLEVAARQLLYPMYFDRAGFPIPGELTEDGDLVMPTLVWARMMEAGERTVAYDEFPDGSYLSTVWLGLDQALFGPPLIFETMRFSGEVKTRMFPNGREFDYHPDLEFPHPEGDEDETTTQLRYRTEEEALAMHHEIARRIRKRWEV